MSFFIIRNCLFDENVAKSSGGVFLVYRTVIHIYNCIFTKNTAGRNAGIIDGADTNTIIKDCLFEMNSAHGNGGVLNIYGRQTVFNLQVINSSFTFNIAGEHGGVLYGSLSMDIAFHSCTFIKNSASIGSTNYFYNVSAFRSSYNNFYIDTSPMGNTDTVVTYILGTDEIMAVYKTYKTKFFINNETIRSTNEGFMDKGESMHVIGPLQSTNNKILHQETIYATG